VASSVNSANSGTGSAGGNSDPELKKWYNDQTADAANKRKFKNWLQASQNPDSATVASKGLQTTVDAWLDNLEPGAYKTEKDKTIVAFDTTHAKEGKTTIKCGEDEYTLEWKPKAQGTESSFQYIDGTDSPTTNTATESKKTMPSLAPFLKLNEPERPKKPEWYEGWRRNIKTAEAAPSIPITDFDVTYGIANNYANQQLEEKDCLKFDRNDKVVMDALMKGRSHLVFAGRQLMIAVEIEGTKLNNTTAATADRLLSAGRMAKTADIPSAMGAYVAKGVYGKAIDESVRDEFEKECVDGFTRAFEHPDPLPVTKDGLDTFTWASVLTKADKHLRVKDEGTKMGRIAQMRELRETFYSKNGTGEYGDKTISFGDATRYACEATDGYLGYPGVKKRDLVDCITGHIRNGTELPQDWLQSILDIAKARDEKDAAMRQSSVISKTPSVLDSWGGPLPAQVPAHQALTSESNTSQSPTKTATKTSLPDSVRERLERLKETVGVKTLNSLFGQFPSQDRAKPVE
jgi:hypothetical protein